MAMATRVPLVAHYSRVLNDLFAFLHLMHSRPCLISQSSRSLPAEHGRSRDLGQGMQMEITMKTITALLTATILVSGAASAMAGQQSSNQAPDYALSWQMTRGATGHHGPYASASHEQNVGRKYDVPVGRDFGGEQNAINFQAQGSN